MLAGLAETGGRFLLALGLLTPFGSAVVISVMVVAVVSVHIHKGVFGQNGGYEYNLVPAVAALALAFAGPGSLSFDALLNSSYTGTAWGLGAVVAGALGGSVSLIERKVPPTVTAATSK
jgi:putative oxidoreductase